MQYIALRELTMGDGRVLPPGADVPEAAMWDRCWFTTGHVGMYTDEIGDQVKQAITGGYQAIVHASQVDHHHLRVALSEQRGRQPTSKGDDSIAGAGTRTLDTGALPAGKESVIADAGSSPNALDDAPDGDDTDDPGQPGDDSDPNRGRRRRRGRKDV